MFPDPQPLGFALPTVAPLEIDLVPEPFRGWIGDIAHRLQTPPDMAAIAALISLASVIGRAVAIRPKARDDWDEVPNLWGGVVAEPGGYKTPNLKAGMQPLNRLVGIALAEHKRQQEEVKSNEVVHEAEIKALNKRIQKAVDAASGKGKGHLRLVEDDDSLKPAAARDDPKELAEQLAELERAGSSPRLRRYVVNDPSVEKLGELLKENDRGLLLFRDELPGFLYKLEEEGHESDRAFYLEAWNGNGQPFTYDRIVRGSIRIESPCVSILGGAQPGPLTRYIRSALKSDSGDDGLIQRFQLLIWPDTLKHFKYVDEWPNSAAKDRAFEIFKRVSEPGLTDAIGAVGDPHDADKAHYVRFDPRSQALFESWYQKLILGVRSGEDHPAICSHRVKYSSTMPALALLFHAIAVADGTASAGPVSVGATALAIRWIDYLEIHARRLYSAFTRRREIAGALLGAKIKAGKVPSPFRVRGDVLLKGWAGLARARRREPGDRGTGGGRVDSPARNPSTQHGGRPTVEYVINPKVHACSSPRAPGNDDA